MNDKYGQLKCRVLVSLFSNLVALFRKILVISPASFPLNLDAILVEHVSNLFKMIKHEDILLSLTLIQSSTSKSTYLL